MSELALTKEEVYIPPEKNSGELSDKQLVEGVRARDDKTFAYLHSKYQHGIRLLVCTNGGTRDDAEDIFNDGILRLMEVVDQEDFRLTCKLPTLLYAICEKKWKLVLVKQRTSRKYPLKKLDDRTTPDFSENIDNDIRSQLFWEGFNQLGEDCRRILKAYFIEIPAQEIAKIFDYSYGYLRKKKSQCMKSLVHNINSHPDYRKVREA